jgi:putative MATE family efflux protein
MNEKRAVFETMPVPRALLMLAGPTIISQLINLIYNAVDAIFIGTTGDAYKTAAVTLAFTIYMINIAIANLFGIGGGSLIARLAGKGHTEKAKGISSFSFWASIGVAAVYSLVIWLFMDQILYGLGASENTINFARQYVTFVIVIGDIPLIISLTAAHLLRNTGYSRQAGIGLSGGGLLNIALDPLFMFVILPEGMEVMGAAVATLVSNVISAAYLVATIIRVSKNAPIAVSPRELKSIGLKDTKEVFTVGMPSALLPGLFDLANIFLNAFMAMHGDLELAAIGIVMRIDRLPNAINIGICQGSLPLVAYNYTSGNHERMNEVIRTARRYGIIVSMASLALFQLVPGTLCSAFMSTGASYDPTMAHATIALAVRFLRLRSLSSVFPMLNYSTSYNLQAVGDGKDTFIHSVVRILGFYIPIMYLLNILIGADGLAVSFAISEMLSGIFVLWLFRRWKRSHIHRSEQGLQ